MKRVRNHRSFVVAGRSRPGALCGILAWGFLFALAGILPGCGGGGTATTGVPPSVQAPPPPTGPPTLFLTPGNWFLSASSAAVSLEGAGDITQNGATLSGFQISVSTDLLNDCWGPANRATMTGVVGGNVLQLTAKSPTNASQTLTITLTGTAQQLTGSYVFTGGTCLNGREGTISGSFVPSFTGTWKGSVTSSTGAVTQVTATVTQGPSTLSDGFQIYLVSGSAVFTGSNCIATGTIDQGISFIKGRAVSLVFTDHLPPTPGTFNFSAGTNAPAATTLTGSYIAEGNCAVENGTGTLTRQ